MSNTGNNILNVRLPEELRAWLDETAAATGRSSSEIVRELIEGARKKSSKPWMSLAGAQKGGPRDLSTKKGFSR